MFQFRFSVLVLFVLLGFGPYASSAQQTSVSDEILLNREWTQHASNAQHTSFVPQEIPAPWRWKWAWNGPDERGAIRPDKFDLPKNVQPVTGDGRVYVAAGTRGVYALDLESGQEVWQQAGIGAINSTVAYHPETNTVIALSASGAVYRLDAAAGGVQDEFDTGAPSDLPLPPAVHESTAFAATGTQVVALDIATFTANWVTTLVSPVQTPPAYSLSTDRIIVATEDLYVSALDNADGSLIWRVKPTSRDVEDDIDYINGWPVIAEHQGLVFVKARLDWDTLWTWNPWPTTNEAIRANLIARPDQQALFALSLDDGTSPFVVNVGHGGYGDGGYLPMGPQPAVRTFPDGTQVLYTVGRGDDETDGRWDSKFVEVVLDSVTVPGYSGGDVRFIEYGGIVLTDEQPNITVAGTQILAGHWMAGYSLQISDRDSSLGSYENRIQAFNLPHITTSASNCGFSTRHYCNVLVQDDDTRTYPAGFYIYYNQGPVYDQYWSEYSTWVVSESTILYRSTDGAIAALESSSRAAAVPSDNLLDEPLTRTTASNPSYDTIVVQSPPHVDYHHARQFAGQAAQVSGTIRFLFNNGKYVYLGFANPHRGSFKVMIPRVSWGNFAAAPEETYELGQAITATGVIRWYQGDPVIFVTAPSQLMLDTPLVEAS
jgi:outer membrane protein assembly factor BamB